MKKLRKISLWTGGIFSGLLLVLFALGYFFEDRIHLLAIRELGKIINARIEVENTNVSFIRSWPDVYVELEGVRINPVKSTYPQDILTADGLSFRIDFWSVFSEEYKIEKVGINSPHFILELNENGEWNYADMFQPEKDSTSTDSANINFAIREIMLWDGIFEYHDIAGQNNIIADSIQIEMDGDFSAQSTDITSVLAFRLKEWISGKMNWADNRLVSGTLNTHLDFLNEGENYNINEATIKLAGISTKWTGYFNRRKEISDLSLAFSTNDNSFKSFLSILPGGLLETGREYEYSGNFTSSGSIVGKVGTGRAPDVRVAFNVHDGAFHYVGYDSRLSEVRLTGKYDYLPASPAASGLIVSDFHAKMGGKPVGGSFSYMNIDDPFLVFDVNGGVDLEKIRDFYPDFAEKSTLSGNVNLNVKMEGRVADFKEQKYTDIKAQGDIALDSVFLKDPRIKYPVAGLSGKAQLDNHHLEVLRLKGEVGSSDFDLHGSVTEYLARIFDENAMISGVLELKSKKLELDEWFLEEEGDEAAGEGARFVFSLPAKTDFEFRVNVGDFHFAKFDAKDVQGICHLNSNQMTIRSLQMKAMGGEQQVEGLIRIKDEEHCFVQLDANSKDIDINKTFRTFDQLAAFALVEENLYGKFSGDVHVTGYVNQYLDLDPSSLVSFGRVELKDGRLVDFEPLEGLAGFVKLEELKDVHFSDVSTDYRIEEEYFYIPSMTVKANRYNLTVSGRHGFDNSLDYKVYVEMPRKDAKRSNNPDVLEMVDEDTEGDPLKIIIPIRITGTVDEPKYALETNFVKESIKEGIRNEGEEIRTAWNNEIEENFGPIDTMEVEDLVDLEESPADNAKKDVQIIEKIKDPLKKLKFPKKLGENFKEKEEYLDPTEKDGIDDDDDGEE